MKWQHKIGTLVMGHFYSRSLKGKCKHYESIGMFVCKVLVGLSYFTFVFGIDEWPSKGNK